MATPQHETMQRKPVLMPPSMIRRLERIAQERKVSFAEVVREAVNAFDHKVSEGDMAILEALADTLRQTAQEVVRRMDELEKKLDSTHEKILEASRERQ
ncbi:MAG: hypothetical protein AB1568_06870 [Thermodesulfobacteriota bacterium]